VSVNDDLREQLAAFEHFQWSTWAADIMRTESINKVRMARWNRLIVTPYEDLTEEEKDIDRYWADQILALIKHYREGD
jgi:hypothetical protein